MSSWLDSINDARCTLRRQAQELGGLAIAFDRTGNERVCDELRFIQDQIDKAEKEIQHAISSHSSEEYSRVMADVGSTLVALVNAGESND